MRCGALALLVQKYLLTGTKVQTLTGQVQPGARGGTDAAAPLLLRLMPYALCLMPYAICDTEAALTLRRLCSYALCLMYYALCLFPYATLPGLVEPGARGGTDSAAPLLLRLMPYASCLMPYALCDTDWASMEAGARGGTLDCEAPSIHEPDPLS